MAETAAEQYARLGSGKLHTRPVRAIRLTDKGRRYLEWLRLQEYAKRLERRERADGLTAAQDCDGDALDA